MKYYELTRLREAILLELFSTAPSIAVLTTFSSRFEAQCSLSDIIRRFENVCLTRVFIRYHASKRMMNWALFVAGWFVIAMPSAWAQSGQTAEQLFREFTSTCDFVNSSHVQVGLCLADATKRMRIRLGAEYKKAIASAEGVAANGDLAGKTGAEIAKIERDDVVLAQRAWQSYAKAECDKVVDVVELGGGNGGDVIGAECEMHHIAARIVELER